MIFKEEFKIELEDIGKDKCFSNKALLKYLENIGADHSSQAGYGILDMERTKVSWILLDWKVRIFKREKYSKTIKINTWSRGSKRIYSYRDFEVFDENNNKIAIATSRWALINIDTGKIERISEDITEKYYPENEFVFEEAELEKRKEPEEFVNTIKYTVNRSDIDINNHMHNLNYLDLAYEALPQEIYEKDEFNNIRITYKKEIKLGETVKCKYTFDKKQNDKHIVAITSEDDSKIHAIIEVY
ncbi:MAG: hypothetical protein IJH39_09990 [Clostridia bacterium]|nr:hypothetical protein [Clostridia bacterium]